MLLTDDRMVESLRAFVTAVNRLETLSSRSGVDLNLVQEASDQQRAAGIALQEALVARGWRRPTY